MRAAVVALSDSGRRSPGLIAASDFQLRFNQREDAFNP